MFKKGDIVRIRSRQELEAEGHDFNDGWVIDKWYDSICEVIYVGGYHVNKLKFLKEEDHPYDQRFPVHRIEDYRWSEFELEELMIEGDSPDGEYKEITINESDIEQMFK